MSPDDVLVERTIAVVDEINRSHGLSLTLRGRADGGLQSGAWILADPRGPPMILKWNRTSDPARTMALSAIVERLRAGGYPTPSWVTAGSTPSGCTYHLQELAPGEPSWPLTSEKVSLLLDVLERHAGLDPDPSCDRSQEVMMAAKDETPQGFRHVVRRLGVSGEALINSYDRLLDAYADVTVPGGDLVHGDFNTCNVLLQDGRVSAVIDIEGLGSGSRVIDHACLLREAYVEGYPDEVKIQIARAGVAVAGPGALAICAAATAFFIVGFKMRHAPERIPATLAGLHRLAVDLAPG